ncbi:MAG: hypothetical protein QG608_1290, partial [Actinomycetota bacterium]|nr:hypothetical protein [Actinomycetota bacterium]
MTHGSEFGGLGHAHGLEQVTTERIERWLRGGVPQVFPRVVLPVLWVICFVMELMSEPLPKCTPTDPGVCGPDEVSTVFLVPLLLLPVLLMCAPLVGCAAGVALSPVACLGASGTASASTFAVHGLLCLLSAVRLNQGVRAQRQEMSRATFSGHAPDRAVQDALHRLRAGTWTGTRTGWNQLALGTAVVLAGGAGGLWTLYESNTADEDAHIARAQTVQGQIVKVSDDGWKLGIRAADRTVEIDTLYPEQYEIGNTVPVLLDPQDPDWARLRAEPTDTTAPLGFAVACLLGAVLLTGRQIRRRRALSAALSPRAQAVEIRVLIEANMAFLLGVEDIEG